MQSPDRKLADQAAELGVPREWIVTPAEHAEMEANFRAEEAERQRRGAKRAGLCRRVGIFPKRRTRIARRPMRGARRRGAGRPAAPQRTSSSSTTSGADPGDDGEPEPPPRRPRRDRGAGA